MFSSQGFLVPGHQSYDIQRLLLNLILQKMQINFGVHWYTFNSYFCFRYAYSHLYTVTATVGLFCLTGIFTFIMLLMHSSDVDINQQTENVQRRQQ